MKDKETLEWLEGEQLEVGADYQSTPMGFAIAEANKALKSLVEYDGQQFRAVSYERVSERIFGFSDFIKRGLDLIYEEELADNMPEIPFTE